MLAPIVISYFATSLAVGIFTWNEYFERYIKRPPIKKNVVFTSSAQDVARLKSSLLKKSAHDICNELRNMHDVYEGALAEAMEILPDTSALVALIFEQQCTQLNKDLFHLRGLSLLELGDVVRKANDELIIETKTRESQVDDKNGWVDFPSPEDCHEWCMRSKGGKKSFFLCACILPILQ